MNIIVNEGFESGTLSPGWQQTPGSAELDGGVTNTTSYSGQYCLELKGLDFVEQVLFFKKGTSELSFQTKVETVVGAGPTYVKIIYNDGTETSSLIPTSTTWQKFSCPVDPCKCISKIQFASGETISRYIDEVYLEGVTCYSFTRVDPPEWLFDYLRSKYPWLTPPPPGFVAGNDKIEHYIMALEDRLVYLEKQVSSLLPKQRKPRKRPGKDDVSKHDKT